MHVYCSTLVVQYINNAIEQSVTYMYTKDVANGEAFKRDVA